MTTPKIPGWCRNVWFVLCPNREKWPFKSILLVTGLWDESRQRNGKNTGFICSLFIGHWKADFCCLCSKPRKINAYRITFHYSVNNSVVDKHKGRIKSYLLVIKCHILPTASCSIVIQSVRFLLEHSREGRIKPKI